MSTNSSSHQQTTTQLETTPRVYYEHYMTAQPNYDLYPSLSRRLGNGYVHRPIRRPKKQQQTNFISIHGTTSRRSYNVDQDPLWQPIPPQMQQETPSWDLYPAILRNVENYGTDQMRQRLRAMEATVTTL